MTMTLSVGPLIALIAGILILVMPRLLNYIVALYLILIGLLGLFSITGSTLFRTFIYTARRFRGAPPSHVV